MLQKETESVFNYFSLLFPKITVQSAVTGAFILATTTFIIVFFYKIFFPFKTINKKII